MPGRRPFALAGPMAVVVAVALAGCTTDGTSPDRRTGASASSAGTTATAAPATASPATAAASAAPLPTTADGLAATLEQYRSDVATRTIQVEVAHRGTRPVRLTGLRLVWAGLTPVAPATRDDLVSPGQIIALSVGFGESVCADPPRGDEEPPSAVDAAVEAFATWEDTGVREAVRIPITDVRGVLARVYEPGCRRQSVTRSVDVAWEPTWVDARTPAGAPARAGALRLTRRAGADPVHITGLSGSVLLSVAPVVAGVDGSSLLTLGADAVEARLAVLVSQSGNCAPHALAESKQTFLLPVTVVMGSRPEVTFTVSPDAAAQADLTAMINAACGVR